jgi:hypothetical protein
MPTTSRRRSPIILVANNPFGHHLLTSQLLDVYAALDFDAKIVLYCNGVMDRGSTAVVPQVEVVSFASRLGGAASYVNLFLRLVQSRWKYPRAAYHLRGFVAGIVFFFSRAGLLGPARYIYDPRGAFFIEWRESGRPKALARLFGWVESRLIRHSVATVVTSRRFARLYARLFGHGDKYLTIYNATSFAYAERASQPADQGNLRVAYLGTFNHWHDMGEVARVMENITREVGPDRVEISIYTLPRFHDAVRARFGRIECAALNVAYVGYHGIPDALAGQHVGVSVVRPSVSSRIASPIKISDYVALGLVPLMNRGIGDFDAQLGADGAAILYRFGEAIDISGLQRARAASTRKIYDLVSNAQASSRLYPAVERLLNG